MEKEEIKWLKDVLKIDSTLGNEKEVADYLEAILKAEGIETKQVEYAKGRNQLIATLKGKSSNKTLGLSGHMDVVPTGATPWIHDPFKAEEEDGKIYARGASDMKAGLVATVAAMIQLKRDNVALNGDVKLLATVGEETSGIGAHQLVKLGYGDNLDALIIAEPTSNGVVVAHKGALWLRLTTKGRTAHGSMPSVGVNAVEHMLTFLESFRKNINLAQYADKLLGTSTSSNDVINGGKSTNVIPDQCVVEIDIRTVAGQDHKALLKELDKLKQEIAEDTPHFDLSIEVINDLNPVSTDANDSFVKLAVSVAEEQTKTKIEPKGLSGYTDGSQFVKAKSKYPIIILGPGNVELAHQPDEYIEIDRYLQSISIYKEIAKKMLA